MKQFSGPVLSHSDLYGWKYSVMNHNRECAALFQDDGCGNSNYLVCHRHAPTQESEGLSFRSRPIPQYVATLSGNFVLASVLGGDGYMEILHLPSHFLSGTVLFSGRQLLLFEGDVRHVVKCLQPSHLNLDLQSSGLWMKLIVIKAEILWTLKVVESGYSFSSCDGLADIFKQMFDDNEIAKSFTLGSTKVAYEICEIYDKFLRVMQCNEPLIHILYDELCAVIQSLRSRIVKPEILGKVSGATFRSLDLYNIENTLDDCLLLPITPITEVLEVLGAASAWELRTGLDWEIIFSSSSGGPHGSTSVISWWTWGISGDSYQACATNQLLDLHYYSGNSFSPGVHDSSCSRTVAPPTQERPAERDCAASLRLRAVLTVHMVQYIHLPPLIRTSTDYHPVLKGLVCRTEARYGLANPNFWSQEIEYQSPISRELTRLMKIPVDNYNNLLTVLELHHYGPLLDYFDYHGRKSLTAYLVANALDNETHLPTPDQSYPDSNPSQENAARDNAAHTERSWLAEYSRTSPRKPKEGCIQYLVPDNPSECHLMSSYHFGFLCFGNVATRPTTAMLGLFASTRFSISEACYNPRDTLSTCNCLPCPFRTILDNSRV
ncbi:hypothetical protein PR048_018665 [Dryococelus australis]|uniref:Uncharacterized protein n=1 Tax=Dryococelus australis TaxID=614101 RepID=A0ABQ9HCX4_9NEOP|nr:hypothetical protein PR048_018665 [Dryococelus australis]